MASYYITYTSETVTFVVSGITSGDKLRFFLRYEPATGSMLVDEYQTAYGSGYEITYGGLSPKTSYAVNVYLNDDERLGTQYFTTPAVESGWSWTKSNGSATDTQTQAAYTAITENGYLTEFSYLVWNDLVSKTNKVVADQGGSWTTTYGSISETVMTESDKVMTARRFNAVLTNLEQYTLTGLSVKYRGDDMLGSYFIALADAINTISSGG